MDFCNDDKESVSAGGREINQLIGMDGERKSVDARHTTATGTDLDDGLPEKPPEESVELVLTDTNLDKMNSYNSGLHTNNFEMQKESTSSHTTDDISVSGVKRAHETYDDQQPSVHISYKSLSRESKEKLKQLLHQWSEWHAQQCLKEPMEILESGEETYFPALHVGQDKYCTVVWKKQRTEDISSHSDFVPLYDRDYAFALSSSDGLANKESVSEILNASRCFNCRSYGHSLKECPKPRDNIVVSNARKEHQSKRNLMAGHRVLTRYYQSSPRGKYDGLTPGSLNAETRKALGLGELDPPPWLNRMREMGYPPGYLDLEEDQPSGITVYADGDTKEENVEISKLDVSEPRRKITVDFPGINAPIPENANQSSWAAPHRPTSFHFAINQSNYRSNCFPEYNSEGNSYHLRRSSGYTLQSNSLLSSYARIL